MIISFLGYFEKLKLKVRVNAGTNIVCLSWGDIMCAVWIITKTPIIFFSCGYLQILRRKTRKKPVLF